MQLPPKSAAVIASVLFASTLGVLIVVASFGFMRLMEQMGEGLGITHSPVLLHRPPACPPLRLRGSGRSGWQAAVVTAH